MTMRRTAIWKCCSKNVRVPATNMLLGEGRGFEIAQGRLGPGRIHHCMRTIGAPKSRSKRCASASPARRVRQDHCRALGLGAAHRRARIDIEMTRLLCLKAARHDGQGRQQGRANEIAMIKVRLPHGAEDHRRCHPGAWRRRRVRGFRSGECLCHQRTLRLADGPDEVHNRSIARRHRLAHMFGQPLFDQGFDGRLFHIR
jgi:acyl-CoA dehydrogenase